MRRHDLTVRVLPLVFTIAIAGCDVVQGAVDKLRGPDTSPPDSLPELLNDSLPFQYPISLYMQLIDDSVTLRLHVDEYGRPVPESTKVEVHATHALFDTSAMNGSRELTFRPAIRKGKPIPYTVLFPIQFKIPTKPIAPNDSTARK
ncbi:MAG: energy transducer TonB [Cytophagaceae bacterium]|nr:energy transducer TonB [Gemmatimonadaceae bacterium]